MYETLRIQRFKSWEDTGEVRIGKLTGVFGTNSSGKTSLLQFILMLKQTAESQDRSRVLHTGSKDTYVDLGTLADVIHGHDLPGTLRFELAWRPDGPLEIRNTLLEAGQVVARPEQLTLEADVHGGENSIRVEQFVYRFGEYAFGMERVEPKYRAVEYKLIHDGYEAVRTPGRGWQLPAPVKSYGFPDAATAYYQNVGFLLDLALAFETQMQKTLYLGPLREYPGREYTWAGERPQDVGPRGELAVAALLASREEGPVIQPKTRARLRTIEEHVAWWLRELGIVHAFELRQIAEGRKLYEVRVKTTRDSPWVLITDVGFGVSQVLPVLVLCFYAPVGSTLIFEQPEIHLHPRVQAGLADVFLDAIKRRGVQIVLESHSEHLLRRLQRRIAEEKAASGDVALYFVEPKGGASSIRALNIDMFGAIRNWPENFFGDELGELSAMTEAAMTRKLAAAGDGV
ncbi:DUF3696 domain-containing protein [Rubrivirga sp.]|uniref:AAA family ATPase n=1 Tax=Rubrivirga sp. TaxID=1885344 RepID=UPI003B51C311